jgi:hypothetical protein
MAILPGTRLGPYEILSAIRAGGMGEVYFPPKAQLAISPQGRSSWEDQTSSAKPLSSGFGYMVSRSGL